MVGRFSLVATFWISTLVLQVGCTKLVSTDFKYLTGDMTHAEARKARKINPDKFYLAPEALSAIDDLQTPPSSDKRASTAAIVLPEMTEEQFEIALKEEQARTQAENADEFSQTTQKNVSLSHEITQELAPAPGVVSQPLRPVEFDSRARKRMGYDDPAELRSETLITLKADPIHVTPKPDFNERGLQPIEQVEYLVDSKPGLPAEPDSLPPNEIVDHQIVPNHEIAVELPLLPTQAETNSVTKSIQESEMFGQLSPAFQTIPPSSSPLAEQPEVLPATMPPHAAIPQMEPLVSAEAELEDKPETGNVLTEKSDDEAPYLGTEESETSDFDFQPFVFEEVQPTVANVEPKNGDFAPDSTNDFATPDDQLPTEIVVAPAETNSGQFDPSSSEVEPLAILATADADLDPSSQTEIDGKARPAVEQASHSQVVTSPLALVQPRIIIQEEEPVVSIPFITIEEEEEKVFHLTNAALCTSVSGFGQFTRFVNSNFKSGQRMLVYCELENFTSVETEIDNESAFRTQLQGSYVIYDSAGKIMNQKEFPIVEDVAKNRRRDFYVHLPVRLGALPPGSYQLQVVIEDLSGKQTASLGQPLAFVVE